MLEESAKLSVQTAGSLSAAQRILPILWNIKSFQKVVDVGCGSGAWLHVSEKLGASVVFGVDGFHKFEEPLLVRGDRIQIADLEKALAIGETFDLCVCVEVAEHLTPGRALTFIGDLTLLSDIILFSAAIPFQGGQSHLNEQWPEYWAELFQKSGFKLWDGLRGKIWTDYQIPWWYRQNILLFVKENRWAEVMADRLPSNPKVLSIVHPECFLWRKSQSQNALQRLDSHWSPTN